MTYGLEHYLVLDPFTIDNVIGKAKSDSKYLRHLSSSMISINVN